MKSFLFDFDFDFSAGEFDLDLALISFHKTCSYESDDISDYYLDYSSYYEPESFLESFEAESFPPRPRPRPLGIKDLFDFSVYVTLIFTSFNLLIFEALSSKHFITFSLFILICLIQLQFMSLFKCFNNLLLDFFL